jgi:hypothetical protein
MNLILNLQNVLLIKLILWTFKIENKNLFINMAKKNFIPRQMLWRATDGIMEMSWEACLMPSIQGQMVTRKKLRIPQISNSWV